MSQSFNNFWLFTLGWITGNYCIPMTSIIVMPYMWIIFSWLISRQSRISFQFHARKNRIPLIFFHGLVISEININKNNIKWFTWSCSLICRSLVFTKNLTEICCVLLVFIHPDIVWCLCHITKQIFNTFFGLISKLFTLGWVISDIKQKGMEYLLINYVIIVSSN